MRAMRVAIPLTAAWGWPETANRGAADGNRCVQAQGGHAGPGPGCGRGCPGRRLLEVPAFWSGSETQPADEPAAAGERGSSPARIWSSSLPSIVSTILSRSTTASIFDRDLVSTLLAV